jgi:hypothetical protein
MKPSCVWHDVSAGHGFVAFAAPNDPSQAPLTLHVVASRVERRTVAWWEAPEGTFICFAEVGCA